MLQSRLDSWVPKDDGEEELDDICPVGNLIQCASDGGIVALLDRSGRAVVIYDVGQLGV